MSVIGKYRRAVVNSEDSKLYFEDLCRTADAELQRQWERDIVAAEERRIDDPAAMDIMGNKLKNSSS